MKRALLLLTIFITLTVTVFSSPKKEEAVEKQTIKVGLFKGPTGFGIINIMENPSTKNADFTFEVLPGPTQMVAKASTGEVDIALFPVNVAAKLYNKGLDYQLAAVVGNGLLYLVTRDESINSIEDLEGKDVYSVGKGATPDYLFAYLTKTAGIDVTADFSYNNPTQLVQLFLAGKVDTIIVPEPFATQVQLKDSSSRIHVDFQEQWVKTQGSENTYPMSVVVVSKKLAEENPAAVEEFLDAYRDSINFVNANSKEAGILIEKFGIFPQALAVPAIPGCNLVFIPADEAKDDVKAFLQVLLDSNPVSIGGQLPDEGFYLSF